ncbi:MAG: hypothetical protein IJN29_10960 [Akkermansia sp.]|nr:hypothetical protein [Akkermansia sp.]
MLPYQTIPQKEEGIAIVGIGGAGAHILQCFAGSSANNVRLYTLSPDEREGLGISSNVEFVQLGGGRHHGMSTGGDPAVGALAAQEGREQMAAILDGVRLLVMVAGMGGGTGSGVAPVLAQMARDAGLFLVSVVVMPFFFEGKRRRAQAEASLEEVARLSDIVFCFENDYMEEIYSDRPSIRVVFEEVDRILARATAAVPMLASSPGFINLGLDDLATVLENQDSRCIFGTGSGYGANRAEAAAQSVLESPLVAYHGALSFARAVIVHIAGGDSLSLTEVRIVMEKVREALADEDVNIFFGTTVKPHLGDEIRVTLIASVNADEFKRAIEAPPVPERVPLPVDTVAAPEPVAAETEEGMPEAGEDSSAPTMGDNIYEEDTEESPELSAEPYVPESVPAVAPAGEDLFPDGEEAEDAVPTFSHQPAMHQPELMPAAGIAVPSAEEVEDELPLPEVVRKDSFYNAGGPPGRYPMVGRRRPQEEDDLDTPPSLDVNDLRSFFPRG